MTTDLLEKAALQDKLTLDTVDAQKIKGMK